MKAFLYLTFLLFMSNVVAETPEMSWTYPPIQISTAGVNASDPQIGVDMNGNTVAVWVENGVIRANNIPYGGSWGNATTLSGSGATTPQLVVDTKGNANAIWVENGVVMASTQPSGGSWSAEVALSGSGASAPVLAVDTNGNVAAAWVLNGTIEAATLSSGGSWPATPEVISASGADSPAVTIGAGSVVAVWHEVNGSTDTIYFSKSSIGGSWSSAVAISSSSYNCVNPNVAIDGTGNVAAIWFRYKLSGSFYSEVYAQAAYMPLNGSFETPVDLSTDEGYYNPNDLMLVVGFDGIGNAVSNWNISLDGSTFSYQAAVKQVGQNWTSPLTLVGQNLCAYGLDLSVDSLGHAVTAFMSYDPSSNVLNITARKMNINAYTIGWSLDYAQFSTGSYNAYPKVDIWANGENVYLASVWMNYDGSNSVIYATTGLGLNFDPPTNLSVVQKVNNFYLFDEYYNTFSWSASTNPNTLGYLIFRNGMLIGNVSADVLQIDDENQTENGPVTYGVAAYDVNCEQSSTVYVSYP